MGNIFSEKSKSVNFDIEQSLLNETRLCDNLKNCLRAEKQTNKELKEQIEYLSNNKTKNDNFWNSLHYSTTKNVTEQSELLKYIKYIKPYYESYICINVV